MKNFPDIFLMNTLFTNLPCDAVYTLQDNIVDTVWSWPAVGRNKSEALEFDAKGNGSWK